MVTTNVLWVNSIIVPANAVQLNISVVPNTNSPVPFPDLPIYVKQSGSADQHRPGGTTWAPTTFRCRRTCP